MMQSSCMFLSGLVHCSPDSFFRAFRDVTSVVIIFLRTVVVVCFHDLIFRLSSQLKAASCVWCNSIRAIREYLLDPRVDLLDSRVRPNASRRSSASKTRTFFFSCSVFRFIYKYTLNADFIYLVLCLSRPPPYLHV